VAAISPDEKTIDVVTSGMSYGSVETVLYFNAPDLTLAQTGAPLEGNAS